MKEIFVLGLLFFPLLALLAGIYTIRQYDKLTTTLTKLKNNFQDRKKLTLAKVFLPTWQIHCIDSLIIINSFLTFGVVCLCLVFGVAIFETPPLDLNISATQENIWVLKELKE